MDARSKRAKRGPRGRTGTLPLFDSAMRHTAAASDLALLDNRPEFLTTGLPSVDLALRGGLPLGALTLVGARPQVGATSFVIGAALEALKAEQPVSFFTERLSEEQLRGRFVVLESRVNGHRFRAGFVSAEDRIAITAARERIPWRHLYVRARRHVSMRHIDEAIFTYRPWLVVADVALRPAPPLAQAAHDAVREGLERLASLARKHHVAIVARLPLRPGHHPPDLLELPALGTVVEPCAAVVLLHRESAAVERDALRSGDDLGQPPEADAPSHAEARVVRALGHAIEPRIVPLRFDQRFAGLLETT